MTENAPDSDRESNHELGQRLVGRVSIFGGLGEANVALLLDRARRIRVSAGEYFFEEGSRGTSAYVLESGRVSVVKQWNGKPHFLRRLDVGDCFGEVALIDFGARSASVRADVDCRAIELSAGDLLEVARRDPEQFALVYMNFARELARRLRAADDRLFRARVDGGPVADDHAFDAG